MPADDPTSTPDRQVVVPHSAAVRLESVDAFAGHLVVEYRREALPRFAVVPLGPRRHRRAASRSSSTSRCSRRALGRHPEWAQPTVRFGYTSFMTPSTVFDHDVAHRRAHRAASTRPCSAATTPPTTSRPASGRPPPTAPASRSRSSGGATPCDAGTPGAAAPLRLRLLRDCIDPGFSVARLSLLDRGVVFAVAHVRGGGEMGRAWYENGKTLTKKNTFTDFVASPTT